MRAPTIASALCVLITSSGCATWKAPAGGGDAPFRARAVTETKQGVQLSAAVLGPQDSLRVFGTDLTAADVQPVWIEVVNQTTHVLWLLRSGVDPDYFSPLEVAWSAHVKMGGQTNEHIDEHFDRLAFPNPIPAGGTSSGLVFTNPQPVKKLLNVDLLGNKLMIPFTLLLPVPGDIAGGHELVHRYADSEISDYDDPGALRRAFENLPCCATTADGRTVSGEPLNVILIGHLDDIAAATNRRGFRRELVGAGAGQWVFGRPPDVVLRKRAQAGASANWLRVWRAPISYQGRAVFVAQAGRPVGGRFAPQDRRIARVHPDVDEVRNLLIHDLMYSGGLEKLGFVSGVGAVPSEQPRPLTDAASYHTDGLRVALFLSTRPLTLSDVDVLDWEPLLPERGAEAAGEADDGGR
jgi:LssY-like putative type I secretion system component LssY